MDGMDTDSDSESESESEEEGVSYVLNAVGTSKRKCKCSDRDKTWLAHWSRGTGMKVPEKCCAKGCGRYTQVGAHVIDPMDKREIWIIPFCQHHNKRRADVRIYLKPGYKLCGGSWKVDCL